ncbi:HD domain-containing protein [Streptomyces sp. I05A-00742]|uniref:HD domain-containing protein n=1 Tax=Streptomyces sp. I05A-00742 TaxID=2732853 RepID=UPI0028A1D7AB|nr:HD domain-containing protein [Streptomyces sp. I05A-00742]
MKRSDALSRALHAPADPSLPPLPSAVGDLLHALDAPPRLAAHLRAVHDVACQLLAWLEDRHPDVVVDREAVLFGAATHDIGKTVHVTELTGPGSAHEEAGRELLLAHGFAPERARFAGTHASWTDPGTTLEDLLVSTADKVWKNKRVPELEDLLISRLAGATGREHWEEYLALDELLGRIGEGADDRLAFQSSFPVHVPRT